MTLRFLSHLLKNPLPIYGNRQGRLEIRPIKQKKNGDSCNTYRVGFENHWGTHVDCPAHFFDKGRSVAAYPAESWLFVSPQVIRVCIEDGELLTLAHLNQGIGKETDIILFCSGWSKKRSTKRYSTHNPGVDASFGRHLRAHFPKVRAVGFDWISLSANQRRQEGRQAHRAFLNPRGKGKPIFIVEDMDLSGPLHGLSEIWVAPLRVGGIDSAPCTVMGIFQ